MPNEKVKSLATSIMDLFKAVLYLLLFISAAIHLHKDQYDRVAVDFGAIIIFKLYRKEDKDAK